MRKKVFASIVFLVTMLFAVVGWAAWGTPNWGVYIPRETKMIKNNGYLVGWEYYDSNGNLLQIDLIPSSVITDYGNANTKGSIAWAVSRLASGEIHLFKGTYPVATSINLSNKHGIAIIGEGISYRATKIETNSEITIFSLEPATYCCFKNLCIDGNDAATGVVIKGVSGAGSYNCVFENVFFEDCTTGVVLGDTSNYQCSEHAFYNCLWSSCNYGLYIKGQNTFNIALYHSRFSNNDTAIYIQNGNVHAFSTVFLSSTTRDIYLAGPMRRVLFSGGETEGSQQFLYYAATSTNLPYSINNFDIIANSSTDKEHFVEDCGLAPATFRSCLFNKSAGVYFNGWPTESRPSTEYIAVKVFDNCVWKSDASGSPTVSPNVTVHPDGESARSLEIKHVNYSSP